jgi:integral membrane protein
MSGISENTGRMGETGAIRQTLRQLRIAALIEGCTLALLVCIAVPLKHLGGIPAATAIMGPIHGIAFIAYLWLIFSTRRELGWSNGEILRLLVPAFIPFGTFFNVGFLRRKSAALQTST